MQEYLSVLVQLTVIAGFIGGGINYIVIRPLGGAIKLLTGTIGELKDTIKEMRDTQHSIDKRLGIVEEQIKVANHRINDLEEVMRK